MAQRFTLMAGTLIDQRTSSFPAMNTAHITLGSITYWGGGFDRIHPPAESIGSVAGTWKRLSNVGDVMLQGVLRDSTRFEHLPDVIAQGPESPRILFFQQANNFDLNGYQLMHRAERLLAPFGRYRGFLTPSWWNITHSIVFLREAVAGEPHLWVTNHWRGGDETQCKTGDALTQRPSPDSSRQGFVKIQVGDDGPLMMLNSVMLYPDSADTRRGELAKIRAALAAEREIHPDIIGLCGGSCNGPMSGPNEPVRDWELAARLDPEGVKHKGKQNEDGTWGPNTTPMDEMTGRWSDAAGRRLPGAGWHSLGDLDGDYEPTVHHEVDKGGPLRINHFLTTHPDILVRGSHRTHPVLTHAAKKHRYITATIAV